MDASKFNDGKVYIINLGWKALTKQLTSHKYTAEQVTDVQMQRMVSSSTYDDDDTISLALQWNAMLIFNHDPKNYLTSTVVGFKSFPAGILLMVVLLTAFLWYHLIIVLS